MTDAPISVRTATLDDLDRLVPLFDGYRRFYGQQGDLERARAFLHERMALRESVLFLASTADADLGFTQLFPGFSSVKTERLWILNDLYVVPEARGRGVGRMLLERARAHARATGAVRVTLSTAADNARAQGLYESFGYRRDGDFFYTLPVDEDS